MNRLGKPVAKLALLLILSFGVTSQKVDTTGAWLPVHMKWTYGPISINPNFSTAEAKILYFDEQGRFALVACRINREKGEYVISNGDGQAVFTGEWDGHLPGHVKYRLVSRTVEIRGETLPGPWRKSKIQATSKGYLLFQGELYRHVEELGPSVRTFLPFGTK
jgi:hypothetical protein